MANQGVNLVILIGNLGKDVETSPLPNGGVVSNISLATSKSWKDKNTGAKQEKTEWHRIKAFGNLAEIMAQYLRKGSKVHIQGELETSKWQDQSGQTRYSTDIIAKEMLMLDSKPTNNAGYQANPNQNPGNYQENNGYQQQPNNQHPQGNNGYQQQPNNSQPQGNNGYKRQTNNRQPQNNNGYQKQPNNQQPQGNNGGGYQDDDIPFQGISKTVALIS